MAFSDLNLYDDPKQFHHEQNSSPKIRSPPQNSEACSSPSTLKKNQFSFGDDDAGDHLNRQMNIASYPLVTPMPTPLMTPDTVNLQQQHHFNSHSIDRDLTKPASHSILVCLDPNIGMKLAERNEQQQQQQDASSHPNIPLDERALIEELTNFHTVSSTASLAPDQLATDCGPSDSHACLDPNVSENFMQYSSYLLGSMPTASNDSSSGQLVVDNTPSSTAAASAYNNGDMGHRQRHHHHQHHHHQQDTSSSSKQYYNAIDDSAIFYNEDIFGINDPDSVSHLSNAAASTDHSSAYFPSSSSSSIPNDLACEMKHDQDFAIFTQQQPVQRTSIKVEELSPRSTVASFDNGNDDIKKHVSRKPINSKARVSKKKEKKTEYKYPYYADKGFPCQFAKMNMRKEKAWTRRPSAAKN